MLPLDQRLIPFNRNGVKENISGLNKLWGDLKYEWIPYRVPPKIEDLSVAGASETWCERSCMIINDLDFLLSLPHHKVTLAFNYSIRFIFKMNILKDSFNILEETRVSVDKN